MSKQHGMNTAMWNLIERTCTKGDPCQMKFGNLFGYLFDRGDTDEFTKEQLRKLAEKMFSNQEVFAPDLDTPIGFAFLGQFIDHDITLDVVTNLGQAAPSGPGNPNIRSVPPDINASSLGHFTTPNAARRTLRCFRLLPSRFFNLSQNLHPFI